VAVANPVHSVDLGGCAPDRRRRGCRRLCRHGEVEPRRQGAHHRNCRGGRVPARRHGHARLFGARHRPWRGHRRGARLQAAAAWVCGQAWLGRCLRRLAAPDRDLHRAAAPAKPADRSVGGAQPLQIVAARDPHFEPVTGRLCADAPARTEPGRGADRIDRRSRVVDGSDIVILPGRPRSPADDKCARLRNSARLGRHVPARPRLGGGGQPRATFAITDSLRRDGGRGRRVRSTALLP
jgi:hypothetical protein